MIVRLGLALLAMLPLAAVADEVQPKEFGKGIITQPLFPPGQAPKGKLSPLTVVRDAKAYAIVLDLIPRKQISRTRPAPPNKDPLLKKPPIDFAKHTLLYISRPSMSRPVFKKIIKGKKEVVVTVEFRRAEIVARPVNVGTYSAVLIPRSDKPIRLELIKAGR